MAAAEAAGRPDCLEPLGQSHTASTEGVKGVDWDEDEHGPYRINSKAWTMNEIRDLPMFMEDVPSDISDNPHLLALQNILYDGQTPEELAEHFKKLGNEAFRLKETKMSNQNALLAYTKGLEMDCKDKTVNATLHSNRAAVSLRLREWAKAVDDCRIAIRLDSDNNKAYFRAAKASDEMKLTSQALGFINDCLKLKPADQEVRTMHGKLKRRLQQEEKARDEQKQVETKQRSQEAAFDSDIRELLENRGVKLGGPLFDISMYGLHSSTKPALSDDSDGAVIWPSLFLYDETNQSDFGGGFDERCALEDQLQIMFPEDRHPHWDEEEKYVWNRLAAYLDVHDEEGGGSHLVKIRTDSPLGEQLVNHRVSPVLVFHVLVAASPAEKVFLETNRVV